MECHSGVKRRLLLMHEMTWMDPKGIVTSPQRALYDSILQYVLIGTVIEMEKLVISGSMRG